MSCFAADDESDGDDSSSEEEEIVVDGDNLAGSLARDEAGFVSVMQRGDFCPARFTISTFVPSSDTGSAAYVKITLPSPSGHCK